MLGLHHAHLFPGAVRPHGRPKSPDQKHREPSVPRQAMSEFLESWKNPCSLSMSLVLYCLSSYRLALQCLSGPPGALDRTMYTQEQRDSAD
jgi:hypothetical protein